MSTVAGCDTFCRWQPYSDWSVILFTGWFFNRKGFYSFNIQITCDHNLVIRHVCVGLAGSCHDANVWDSSTIKEWAENLPPVYYILGDLAYPLRTYLLTPLRNITSFNLDSMQERYNYVHSSLRMSVECCIGVLKGRFRRLRYFQPLSNGKIVSANNDILASICIHNFCRADGRDPEEDCEVCKWYALERRTRHGAI